MKLFFSVLLALFALNAKAEDLMPASCQPLSVTGESVMLTTKEPVLVLIRNLSKTDLWITHPVSEAGASAGWSSRLQASNWSALVLDKDSFELSCIESKPGHQQQIACASAIAVCLWSPVKMSTQGKGTYWAGEDMNLAALSAHLSGRGFGLPAAAQ